MMKRALMGIVVALAGPAALAQDAAAGVGETADAVFEQVWSSASTLKPELRGRLGPQFMETVILSGDDALIQRWQSRTGAEPRPPYEGEDWALSKARALVEAEGWDGFISRARTRQAPMNMGRPEKMAAATLHLADDAMAERLISEMFTMAAADRSEAGFEKASFGHSLAEVAMQRCDIDMFDRALALTDGPDGLRYAFWRARMTGDVSSAAARIGQEHDGSSTSVLRQALDGYSAVLRLGVCPAPVNGVTPPEAD